MAKSDKTERRAAVEQIRRQQKRADQRQGMVIIGVSIVIMVTIIGAASYKPVKDWWDERKYAGKSLSEIGAPAADACGELITKKASGEQGHVDPGTPVPYEDAPPAFGMHENSPEPIKGKFYTEDGRPNVEKLVHNLEHGYTLLWYDESVAEDDEQIAMLRAIAGKLDSTTNYRDKFKIVPWLESDGEPFPDDQHIALTHWAKESTEEGDKEGSSYGIWQYCSETSGEALDDFMKKYDYTNSPEPTVE